MPTNRISSKVLILLIQLLVLMGAISGVAAATPFIASVASPVLVGTRFTISGSGFSSGSMVNFFVSTSIGAINEGPLKPTAASSTLLAVDVPVDVPWVREWWRCR